MARDLPLLQADESKVKQMLFNLLSNAVKVTPQRGSVWVRARRHGDGGIEISVDDSGIGIAEEDFAAVFEPLRQVESSLSRRLEGTGLGLPLVKNMIELRCGMVEVDSRLGAGTMVTLVFPAERVFDVADAAQ